MSHREAAGMASVVPGLSECAVGLLRQGSEAGDPSLRLKDGCAQDDRLGSIRRMRDGFSGLLRGSGI
jgi:hypothetical protein